MGKTNGIDNVDTDQMKQMRATVVEQELSARSWIAMREKMEATIAIHNMQEEYDKIIKINQENLDKQRAEMQKMFDGLKEDLEKGESEDQPVEATNTN